MARTFAGPVPVPAAQTSALRVLVTGASRGIGFELVKQYAAAHVDNIVIAAVRHPNGKSSEAVQALVEQNNNVHVVQLDVDNEQQIKDSASEVSKLTDSLDIVINNAAIVGESDPLKTTRQEFTTVFTTNVLGALTVTQTYLPLLRKSAVGAKVINVSSKIGSNHTASILGQPYTCYGVTKAALNYLNTVFTHAVPDVMFLAITPGWVATGESIMRTT